MLKISAVYNKDGASLLRRKGYEGQERHHNFRHFSGLSGLGDWLTELIGLIDSKRFSTKDNFNS
jgi:hypothetical protein